MNISQAATLQTPTSNLVSSLPLPSIVSSGLAKFGLLTRSTSSSWFDQLGWFGRAGENVAGGQEVGGGGWASKQVLGSVLAMIATLLVLEQVSPGLLPCTSPSHPSLTLHPPLNPKSHLHLNRADHLPNQKSPPPRL